MYGVREMVIGEGLKKRERERGRCYHVRDFFGEEEEVYSKSCNVFSSMKTHSFRKFV
jgi:hypothetical protein